MLPSENSERPCKVCGGVSNETGEEERRGRARRDARKRTTGGAAGAGSGAVRRVAPADGEQQKARSPRRLSLLGAAGVRGGTPWSRGAEPRAAESAPWEASGRRERAQESAPLSVVRSCFSSESKCSRQSLSSRVNACDRARA